MNFKTWAPLWSGIVDSSIWDEPDYVVKIFLTMMALKDADHVVRLTAYQIGKRAKKTELEVLDALKILSSPDTKRLEAQEYEGRRIQSTEEGWLMLNGQKYRDLVQLEMLRAKNRRASKAFRERKKMGNGDQKSKKSKISIGSGPSFRERDYEKRFGDGEDVDAPKEGEF